MASDSDQPPFAHRHKSAINLSVGLLLLASAIAVAIAFRAPTVVVPLLVASLASIRLSTGEQSTLLEVASAVQRLRPDASDVVDQRRQRLQ